MSAPTMLQQKASRICPSFTPQQSTDTAEVVDPVTPRSNWKGAWQQRVPRAGQSNVVHNDSLESIESPVSPHMPTKLDQLQSADDGQREHCSPTSSNISRDRQTRLLSREQSFARVAAKNQHAKIEPFQAWAVDTGQWGGRELTLEDPDPFKSLPSVTEVSLQGWMAASET
jgi:hypothetical protein